MGLIFVLITTVIPARAELTDKTTFPGNVSGGEWNSGHLQGMTIDDNYQNMYFSFTGILIKTDMKGQVIGSVTGITGHLGDLAFHQGKVFGSLEHKKDNAFYIAVFDVDKITETGMSAQTARIMTTMYLSEVSKDFSDTVIRQSKKLKHRYGCSGIDGITFGTVPGSLSDQLKLMVAYGIFRDTARKDNDYQIILQYDLSKVDVDNLNVFNPGAAHTEGPQHEAKYFVYTGNTTYGVQNLEYDKDTRCYWMAVYQGTKPEFPNFPLYLIDGNLSPVKGLVKGQESGETGMMLTLAKQGLLHINSGVCGFSKIAGKPSTGLVSLGENLFYIAESGASKKDGVEKQFGYAQLYRLDRKTQLFSRVHSCSKQRRCE